MIIKNSEFIANEAIPDVKMGELYYEAVYKMYRAGILTGSGEQHLFKAKEALGMRLAVLHNLYFYNKLMERIRNALDEGTFQQFRNEYSVKLGKRI